MDPTRWEQIQRLFHEALGHSESERLDFLNRSCAEDPALLTEVLELLREDSQSQPLLDTGLAHAADRILGNASRNVPPAKVFGRYQILRLIGEGGMGVVYLAERQDLGNQVAIKLLRDAWVSPARRERFAFEQRVLAQLNHPGIARLYDADTLPDGTPWFAMEYVEGIALTDYCERHWSSIPERLRLFRQVCEAVRYAHAQATIHRDLKPSNILVKPDGTIRLLDFGIAKPLDELDIQSVRARTTMRLMTPAYAAPEQLEGGRIGTYTDVYALGVILYELLTGQVPFPTADTGSPSAAPRFHRGEPPRPSLAGSARRKSPERRGGNPSRSSGHWGDLDVMCLTALHPDVERRYRSVEALIRDLDHFLAGEPLEARPDSLHYRLSKFVARNRRSVAATVVVVVLLSCLTGYFTLRLADARNQALAEAARSQRIQNFMLNLFSGGDDLVAPADDLRVVALLDRGVQAAGTLASEPDIQAELYSTLGGIYQKLGKFDQAESLLQLSHERKRSIYGDDHRSHAESLVSLGLLSADRGRLEEAEQHIRQALMLILRILPGSHPVLARAQAALGRVLQERGLHVEAVQALEDAVRIYSEAETETPELAAALSELANTHFYAGRYDASEQLNIRVLEINRRLYGDRHPSVADDLINLGAIAFERGRFTEAEGYYRKGLDIVQTWYGDSHFRTASALTMLGRALVPQTRFDDASEYLQRALSIHEQVYGPRHRTVASVLNELGLVALRRQNFAEAEARFTRMLEIYRDIYSGRHQFIGIALSNLAGVHLERGDPRRAEALFEEALQLYAELLDPNHPLIGIARVRAGNAAARQGRWRVAESHILAGLEILGKQSSPPPRWVEMGNSDLERLRRALAEEESSAANAREKQIAELDSPPDTDLE